MFVGLFVGIWIARYLGPDGFGLLNFAIAFVALFSPLADLGLQAVVVRELVKRPEDRAQIVASALTLRLIGSIMAVLLVSAYVTLSRPDAAGRLVVIAVALSLIPQSWDVIDFDYQSRMHARPIVIIRTVSLLMFALVKVALILSQADVLWFAAATTGEIALSALCMRVLFDAELPSFSVSQASRLQMAQLLKSCWPLAISSLSIVLYMRIDQVMIGEMLGHDGVGLFSAAVRVSEAWYFIPVAIATAISPALTVAHATSKDDYGRKLLLSIRLLLGVSIAIAAPLTFWSDEVVALLYGPQYLGAGAVLAIHAWAGVFASLGVAAGPWFVNEGLLKWRMWHTLIGASLNVLLNLVLVPRMGLSGAALATLVSYALAGFGFNALTSRTMPIFLFQIRALSIK